MPTRCASPDVHQAFNTSFVFFAIQQQQLWRFWRQPRPPRLYFQSPPSSSSTVLRLPTDSRPVIRSRSDLTATSNQRHVRGSHQLIFIDQCAVRSPSSFSSAVCRLPADWRSINRAEKALPVTYNHRNVRNCYQLIPKHQLIEQHDVRE